MSRVLVTGATGFVGRSVCRSLLASGHEVIGTTRGGNTAEVAPPATLRVVGDQTSPASWRPVLDGVDAVVHLAARVHIMHDTSDDPLQAFRLANVMTTQALAGEALRAGVKRFVFISTIKVLGEGTAGRPFTHSDRASPVDPYSVSKSEAENAVCEICSGAAMESVILRPTMVYGPGVGGNLQRVFSLVQRGFPTPLASVANARTMLGVENFCDVIELALQNQNAAGEALLVADGEALSTPQLFRIVAESMGKGARLFPFPVAMLKLAGKLLGKSTEIDRLCGDLEVDISHTRELLGWSPRVTAIDGLKSAVESFLRNGSDRSD